MATYLSERDIRARRRENQRDEEERGRIDLLEEELRRMEIERVRLQREQLIRDRIEDRHSKNYDGRLTMESKDRQMEDSYGDYSRIRSPEQAQYRYESLYNTVDETGFGADEIVCDSTRAGKEDRVETQEDMQDSVLRETRRLAYLFEDLDRLESPEALSRGKEAMKPASQTLPMTGSKDAYTDSHSRPISNTYANAYPGEGNERLSHGLSYGQVERNKDRQRNNAGHGEEIKAKIAKEETDIFTELSRKTELEYRMDILERINREREIELERTMLEEKARKQEAELRQKLFEDEKRNKLEIETQRQFEEAAKKQKQIEMELLRKRIDLEKEKRKEMHRLRALEEDVIDRKLFEERSRMRIDRRNKQKEEELELLKEIENLRIQEQRQLLPYDEEDRLMEERIRRLKEEKQVIGDRLQKRNVPERRKASDEIGKTFSKPVLPKFDGSQFEEWKLEVVSHMESSLYKDHILAQTVRNSVAVKAREVLLTLKPSASTKEIMEKMEEIYGNLRSGDSIVYDFYSAKQEHDEPCSQWGVRIEILCNKAVQNGEIEEIRKDKKLKERFWKGLISERIQTATRNIYESKESFAALRKKARIEELELESKERVKEYTLQNEAEVLETTQCRPLQTANSQSKLDELLKRMESMEKELKELPTSREQQQQQQNEYRGYNWNNRSRGRYGYRGNRYNGQNRYRDNNSRTRWNEANRQEQRKPENNESLNGR